MKIQSIALGIVAILIIAGGLVAVQAGNDNNGNGAPSGKHYTLNILGKDWDKGDYATIWDETDENFNPVIKNDNGHRIFVKLGSDGNMKKTRILLECGLDFDVIDADGTDGKAVFQLPLPETIVDEITGEVTSSAYTVWIRVLGPPRGQADMYSGFYDPLDGSTWVSLEVIEIRQNQATASDPDNTVVNRKSPPKFVDVTKELTTIYVDMDGDTIPERYNLFHNSAYQYFWDFDNQGIKHVQLRFYDYDPTA
jgi:hypothetical protein